MAIAVAARFAYFFSIDTLLLVTTFLTTNPFPVYPTIKTTTFTFSETTIDCSVQHSIAAKACITWSSGLPSTRVDNSTPYGLLMSCGHLYPAGAFPLCVSTFFLYVWGMYLVCALYCMVLIFAAAVGACESWCYIPLNLAFVLKHRDFS